MHFLWLLLPLPMTIFVFNDSSLQKWPSRKQKKQGKEEEEETADGGRGKRRGKRRKPFKVHVKNYRKVVGEKHFFIKIFFKLNTLILSEF